MTTLRDPFDVTHKKDIKNKHGEVVLQVDYVGWSQSADRLDEAAPGWSFKIVNIGPDWVHGRLELGDQVFENIGYAENAEADWKKEVLKDAASDAFKRCAALAGVARYLYDKDAPPAQNGHARQPTPAPTPIRVASPRQDPYPEDLDQLTPIAVVPVGGGMCPVHHQAWTLKPGGTSKTTGKPYGPFYACPSIERPWCKEKPSLAWVGSQGVPA